MLLITKRKKKIREGIHEEVRIKGPVVVEAYPWLVIYLIKKILFSKKSKYQKIDVVILEPEGKSLILDGDIQFTENKEFTYHEPLVFVPMLTHPNPKKILILGGGDCCVLEEVLKWKPREVTIVEIDEDVINVVKKFFPKKGKLLKRKNVKLVIGDGRKFVERCREKFDVIITDLTVPLEGGPSTSLFTLEFYKSVRKILKRRGVFTTYVPFYKKEPFLTIHNTIKRVFKVCRPYLFSHPEEGGFPFLAFVIASETLDPLKIRRNSLVKRLKGKKCKLFTPDFFYKLFYFPKELLDDMKKFKGISTDKKPFSISIYEKIRN